jgi:pimeloyl-ACP methyl ester carboxylesterase
MPLARIDGIRTHYEVSGDGPHMLLLTPEGFDMPMARRRLSRLWRGFDPVQTLARDFCVIAYDRREAGKSAGRIEPLTWRVFARHAKALLDHLGIAHAYLLGGCIGCSVGLAFAAEFPESCSALMLHWPVGGFRWLMRSRGNFERHIAFARECGLGGVVERARQSASFWSHPEAGPWSSVIASDPAFAAAFLQQDLERYLRVVAQTRDALFSDTLPSGATAHQLTTLHVPVSIMAGDDASHTASCAQTLRELIPHAKLAPFSVQQQTPAVILQWIYEATGVLPAERRATAA